MPTRQGALARETSPFCSNEACRSRVPPLDALPWMRLWFVGSLRCSMPAGQNVGAEDFRGRSEAEAFARVSLRAAQGWRRSSWPRPPGSVSRGGPCVGLFDGSLLPWRSRIADPGLRIGAHLQSVHAFGATVEGHGPSCLWGQGSEGLGPLRHDRLRSLLGILQCVSACNFDPLRRGIGVQF